MRASARANGTAVPDGRRRRRRRRRHGRRLVRVVPAPRPASNASSCSRRPARPGREQPGGRHRPQPGRHPDRRSSSASGHAGLLPSPARRARHRLRLRRRRATSCPASPTADVAAGPRADGDAARAGLDVEWLEPDEVDRRNPTMAPGRTLGGTYCAERRLHRPAAQRDGLRGRAGHGRRRGPRADRVHRAAHRRRPGHRRRDHGRADRDRAGRAHRRPEARPTVGALAGVRIPVGGVRHQVAVTEPHPDLDPARLPMVFDLARRAVLAAGGGRPAVRDEQPRRAAGRGPRVDWAYLRQDAAAARRAGAGDRRARAAPGLGGHHRLHPRPPADPRSRARAPDGPVDRA